MAVPVLASGDVHQQVNRIAQSIEVARLAAPNDRRATRPRLAIKFERVKHNEHGGSVRDDAGTFLRRLQGSPCRV